MKTLAIVSIAGLGGLFALFQSPVLKTLLSRKSIEQLKYPYLSR